MVKLDTSTYGVLEVDISVSFYMTAYLHFKLKLQVLIHELVLRLHLDHFVEEGLEGFGLAVVGRGVAIAVGFPMDCEF